MVLAVEVLSAVHAPVVLIAVVPSAVPALEAHTAAVVSAVLTAVPVAVVVARTVADHTAVDHMEAVHGWADIVKS